MVRLSFPCHSREVLQIQVFKLLISVFFFLPFFALSAHHPTGGEIPQGFTSGLLSGLAHPILNIEHLFFLIAIGLLTSYGVRSKKEIFLLPSTFIIPSLFGVLFQAKGPVFLLEDLSASLTLCAVGLLCLFYRKAVSTLLFSVFLLGGLTHGLVYGESIVGAEPTPLGAYLLGLAFIQTLLCAGVCWLMRPFLNSSHPKMTSFVLRAFGCSASVCSVLFLL